MPLDESNNNGHCILTTGNNFFGFDANDLQFFTSTTYKHWVWLGWIKKIESALIKVGYACIQCMYCKFSSYTYILLAKKNPLQVTTITITIIFPQKGRTASLGQQHISSPSLVHILCQSLWLVLLRPKTVSYVVYY